MGLVHFLGVHVILTPPLEGEQDEEYNIDTVYSHAH